MGNKSSNNSVSAPVMPHNCGLLYLGPLSFHSRAVGDQILLSEGCRHAERIGNTFRNGMLFSNRPVKVNERIRVRVQKHSCRWKGALRLGFTNLPPSDRSLPLASMAIPNLTNLPGHWAVPAPEPICNAGSELEFWVSDKGKLYCKSNNEQYKLMSRVNVRLPLWAMIDLYGQTCSIFLLGSEKKDWCFTRRSCPAPKPLSKPEPSPDLSDYENLDDCISCINMEIPAGNICVVCMVRESTIPLPCGHQCMCHHCTSKVVQQFGTCPMCRQDISNMKELI